MPLARIRTELPSIPEELRLELRLAGYEIEVVRPGKKRSKRADLEITLEALPTGEAMAAAASANSANTVYVAPGALGGLPSKVAPLPMPASRQVDVATRQSEDDRRMLAERRAEQEKLEAQRLRLEQETLRQDQERKEAEQQRLAQQHTASAHEERLRVERERVEAESRQQQRVLEMWREAEARHAASAEAEAIKHEAELAEARKFEELRAQQERELLAKEEEHRRWQAEQARIQQEQEQLRLELQRKQEELRSEQQRLRAERERLQRDHLMAAQAVERPRHSVEPPATNVLPIAVAPAPEPTVIRAAAGESGNLGVPPVETGRQFVERRRSPRLPLIQGGKRRLRHKEYRRAAFAAAGLTVFVMALWGALSSRQPASPLATTQLVQTASMEQSSPFGPAKLNAPVQVRHPEITPAVPAKQLAAAPQKPAVAVPGQQAKKSAKPTPKKKARATRRRSSGDDELDQEVVVRHFGTRTAASKKTASTKDGVKVFSDMD